MMVNDSLLSGQFIKLYLPKIVLMMKWLLLWDLGRLSWLSEQGGALGPSPGEIATTWRAPWGGAPWGVTVTSARLASIGSHCCATSASDPGQMVLRGMRHDHYLRSSLVHWLANGAG